MQKTTSLKQVEANRRNAGKSTGPKSRKGQKVSRMNAVRHGVLSAEVVVEGLNIRESRAKFRRLSERFRRELMPVGPVEEMLVDQIVTARWRLRRALTAESGEDALSVDGGQWERWCHGMRRTARTWELESNPEPVMQNSVLGNRFMGENLREVRARVEAEGELAEAAVQSVQLFGKPYAWTERLEELRLSVQANPEELAPEVLRQQQKEKVLAYLEKEIHNVWRNQLLCQQREESEENARQAAATVPAREVMERLMRYETKLERQMYRAMVQLERLQRMRLGEMVRAPVSVVVA